MRKLKTFLRILKINIESVIENRKKLIKKLIKTRYLYIFNVLKLSVHIDDTVHGFIKNDLEKIDNWVDVTYKLKNELPDESLIIFSRYNLPLTKLTKLDREENAKKIVFADIMEHTWFCHSLINGKTCGLRNPGIYTREEGMGRRVPNPSIKNKMLRFSRKVKRKIIK